MSSIVDYFNSVFSTPEGLISADKIILAKIIEEVF